MQRTTVLLLFGGESSEHDVSVSSARNVYAAIDDEKYEVLLGYIDRQGKWWLLNTFSMQIDTHGTPQLLPALGGRSFITMPDNRVVRPDVILPILHGKNGEDGALAALGQLLHIPVVGCDMTSSAIGMDKLATKEILKTNGIKVVPYVVHYASDNLPDFNKLSMTLGCPLFIKPARAGSSVGVSKAYSEEEFVRAIELALEHDTKVLVEQAVTARELEVAVLGTPPNHQISGVGEIKPGDEFYSYDDKYASTSGAQLSIPADIDDELRERLRSLSGRIYKALGCRGLSRVDFFLAEDGTVYCNEINTLPGFTNISMYPKLWREQGISYSELIEHLLNDALGRGTIKAEITEEI